MLVLLSRVQSFGPPRQKDASIIGASFSPSKREGASWWRKRDAAPVSRYRPRPLQCELQAPLIIISFHFSFHFSFPPIIMRQLQLTSCILLILVSRLHSFCFFFASAEIHRNAIRSVEPTRLRPKRLTTSSIQEEAAGSSSLAMFNRGLHFEVLSVDAQDMAAFEPILSTLRESVALMRQHHQQQQPFSSTGTTTTTTKDNQPLQQAKKTATRSRAVSHAVSLHKHSLAVDRVKTKTLSLVTRTLRYSVTFSNFKKKYVKKIFEVWKKNLS